MTKPSRSPSPAWLRGRLLGATTMAITQMNLIITSTHANESERMKARIIANYLHVLRDQMNSNVPVQ